MVIVTGGIDLSTGSLVAFTTVVVARLLKSGYSPGVAVLGGLVVAAGVGALIGTLVGRFKMMPFVVTLGAMSILRGGAKGLADEQKIDCDTKGLEKLLSADSCRAGPLDRARARGPRCAPPRLHEVRPPRLRRRQQRVGGTALRHRSGAGEDPRLHALQPLVGIAGVMELSTLTVGDPTDSIGLELDVIAAVVIGGASLAGGEGSVVGSVLGALLMTVIKTGAVHKGMPSWTQEIATGAIYRHGGRGRSCSSRAVAALT